MDILAHGLWAGAAATWLRGTRPAMTRRAVAALVAMSIMPDIVPLLPVAAASIWESAPLSLLYAHVTALPGGEPPMSPAVHAISHHLHCGLHSVVVAAVVTAIMWWARPRWVLPLLGWWLHILLDIPTHSGDYYPVPLFYPITYWGVDGIAWPTPWFLGINYLALVAVYAFLLRGRRRMTMGAD